MGIGTWTETRRYYAKCSLTGFANDKIRVVYKINGTYGATIPEFSNDSPDGNGKRELNETEKHGVIFNNTISVRQ